MRILICLQFASKLVGEVALVSSMVMRTKEKMRTVFGMTILMHFNAALLNLVFGFVMMKHHFPSI
jgi:hypothetical protein